MKYLETAEVAPINSMLRSVRLNDTKISGALDVYSCRQTDAHDKKLIKELEQRYVEEVASSPMLMAQSPIGDMTDHRIRKTMIHLITTLNASYPEYDFSNLKPEDFVRETDFSSISNSVNLTLAEVADYYGDSFLESLWMAIQAAINPEDCEVFSYIPDANTDPQSDGKLWSLNYFFYNRRSNRMLFFYCSAKRLSMHLDEESDTSSTEDMWIDTPI